MRMMVATPAAVAADTAVILVPAPVAAGDVGAIGVLGVLVDRLVVVAVLGIAVLVVVVATMLLAVAVVTMLAVVHLPKVAGSCAVESTGRPPRPVRQDQETRSAPLVHPPDRQPRHACLSLPGLPSNLGAPARVSLVCSLRTNNPDTTAFRRELCSRSVHPRPPNMTESLAASRIDNGPRVDPSSEDGQGRPGLDR